jgi:K+-transporting ATPase A subunit
LAAPGIPREKIDVREMKMTALAILVTPTLVLLGTALAMMTEPDARHVQPGHSRL